MRLAFRADVSREIGSGHIVRTKSVADQAMRAGHEVRFVVRHLDLDPAAYLGASHWIGLPQPSVPFSAVPGAPHANWAGLPQQQDAEETAAALADWRPDAVIVDHYAFDATWHRRIKAALATPIMVIDDLADRAIDADWLVDHNFHPDHRAKYGDRISSGATLLAGPAYAMLSSAYVLAPRWTWSPEVRSIGVFLGGVDLRGDTLRVLTALDELGWRGPVEVVSTSANPALDDLAAAVSSRPHATLSRDLPDLSAFFARHDLQIGAGGGAMWERCRIGPPTLALICAENQRLSIPHLERAGVIVALDLLAAPSERSVALAQAIEAVIGDPPLRRSLSEKASALVDGRGCERIVAALSKR